jgi:ribosomal protein L37AE/L43A
MPKTTTDTDRTAASPQTGAEVAVPECPFCGSDAVERELSFGSALSKRQYSCRDCATVFEGIRWVACRPSSADE